MSENGPKIILFAGPGKGKTVLAKALAELYADRGINHRVVNDLGGLARAQEAVARHRDLKGFLILVTNSPAELLAEIAPWQVVEIHGGEVLKQGDLSEMATEGLGPSKTLYGMPL